jgi:hypothetical protein
MTSTSDEGHISHIARARSIYSLLHNWSDGINHERELTSGFLTSWYRGRIQIPKSDEGEIMQDADSRTWHKRLDLAIVDVSGGPNFVPCLSTREKVRAKTMRFLISGSYARRKQCLKPASALELTRWERPVTTSSRTSASRCDIRILW